MTGHKKFDVVIGNPPYQEEATGGGTRDTPVYHRFMDAAYEVASKVVLITPARFLFNAGFTPKAWNQKMLADPRLTVPHYVTDSGQLFPGTDIKGGIAVTSWDERRDGEPIMTFTGYPELNSIIHKVMERSDESLTDSISSGRAYSYTKTMHDENPQASALMSGDAQFRVSTNAFEQLPFLFSDSKPQDDYESIRVLGLIKNKRFFRWIRSEYLTGPANFGQFKVGVAKANGSGAFGEVLSSPLVIEPKGATTMSFVTIGGFDEKEGAEACLKYIKTKFARAMLGVLKITQDNPAKVWKHVPLQDFTISSDIDWTKSVPEIDRQLYAKYGFNADEVAFIEKEVKPME